MAGMTMVTSFIILALPISVIGANFTQQWIVFKENQQLQIRAQTLAPQLAALNKVCNAAPLLCQARSRSEVLVLLVRTRSAPNVRLCVRTLAFSETWYSHVVCGARRAGVCSAQ